MGFEFEEQKKKDTNQKKDKEEFFEAPDAAKYADLQAKLGEATQEQEDDSEQERIMGNCVCWGDFG